MSDEERIANLIRALDMARTVIRNYEMDIHGNQDWLGVDLVELGFCQGDIYRNALRMIDRIEKGEFTP